MVQLTSARVWKYKSIEDSTAVDIEQDVTVLVGKNESGKTGFLEALHKTMALDGTRYSVVSDYPRKDYISYLKKHDKKEFGIVAELAFRVDAATAEKINKELFHGVTVVPKDLTFTQAFNYGNGSTISLPIDRKGALAALKKQLAGIEHVDTLFDNAENLADVLTKIEGLEEADDKLKAFATLWRSRSKAASVGWDLINYSIWSDYLSPALPKFLYFDDYRLLDGKINLESLKQRNDNGTLTETDETVMGLFDLAGIDIDELMSEEGYETSRAKLEAIGLNITSEVFEFWKQNKELSVEFDVKADPRDEAPFNSGKNLYIRIKNLRHGVTVPFDQRSKGFIWFFSFMVWFSAINNRADTDKNLILLLDEPGLNLHALAQEDFLAYIDKLSEEHQLVYSTHSPFMVDSGNLQRVRVVEDKLKEGTKVTSNLAGSSDESLFPLQAALGYSIAQNLFVSKKNVLVEGPADLILLQHMSGLLEQVGKNGLADGTIVPVGGLDKLVTFVALLGSSKLELVVLHDKSSTPNQKLEEMVSQKLIERKRVLDYSLFRDDSALEADMEDLVPDEIYIEAFNKTYAKELAGKGLTLKKDGLGKHPRIVERINVWLKENGVHLIKDGGYNHYRVAQTLLPMLTVKNANLDTFEKLFTRLNGALGSSSKLIV